MENGLQQAETNGRATAKEATVIFPKADKTKVQRPK